jgi:two-component system response regulator RpfG
MTGVEVIKKIREINRQKTVPIIMVTEFGDQLHCYQALKAGAHDFIPKPVDGPICQQRCKNYLELRGYQASLENDNRQLVQDLDDSNKDALLLLARAGEFRDMDTGNHIKRMCNYSRLIAEAIGLDDEECEIIELASAMHDLGKIGIPDQILLKEGELTSEEMDIMRNHTLIGFNILSGKNSRYLKMGAEIALNHHEKYDGTGYPNGLQGKEIPISARIVAIADVFDALTSRRPYKEPWSFDEAFEYLEKNAERHFDPECIKAVKSRADKVHNIYKEFHEESNVVTIHPKNNNGTSA